MSVRQLRGAAWEKRYELLIGLILGVIVLLTLARLIFYLVHSDGSKARIVGLPIPVQILPASYRQLNESLGASGTIEPSAYTVITSKVNGKVLAVPIDLGSTVKPGALLVKVDDTVYKARLRYATEAYDHASHQLERVERLYKENLALVSQVEVAQAAKANALQNLLSAQLNLSHTEIRSPAEAVVLERAINPGQFTHADQLLIELGAIEPAMMVVEVGEDRSGSVRMGMPAFVGIDAFPGQSFEGEVAKISAEVSPVTHTFSVYVKVANRDRKLKPGLTGYARLTSSRQALAVPSVAVMNPVGDHVSLFILGNDRRVHLREVRRGAMSNGFTELLSGVNEGEQVVTVGQLQLRDNDVVNVNRFGPWNAVDRLPRQDSGLGHYWARIWHRKSPPI